jgi:hypothetical protein
MWTAFKDLIAGKPEEFIGKLAAVLNEWGVPTAVIDKITVALRTAIQWVQDLVTWLEWFQIAFTIWWMMNVEPILDTWRAWFEENLPKAWSVLVAVWDGILKPALEGLWLFIKDNLNVILLALAGVILVTVVPALASAALAFITAALPIVLLGAALIALGMLWNEFGGEVTAILGQLQVIIGYVFSQAIGWVISFLETLAGIQWPDWLNIPGEFGAGFAQSLEDIKAKVDDFNRTKVNDLAQNPIDTGRGWDTIKENYEKFVAQFQAQNQDNSRNMTNYGGITIANQPGASDPLAALWNQGQ